MVILSLLYQQPAWHPELHSVKALAHIPPTLPQTLPSLTKLPLLPLFPDPGPHLWWILSPQPQQVMSTSRTPGNLVAHRPPPLSQCLTSLPPTGSLFLGTISKPPTTAATNLLDQRTHRDHQNFR